MTIASKIRQVAVAALVLAAPLQAAADNLLLLPGIQLPPPPPLVVIPPVLDLAPAPIFPSCPSGFHSVERNANRVACRASSSPSQFAALFAMAEAVDCQHPGWGPQRVEYVGPPTQPTAEWSCTR